MFVSLNGRDADRERRMCFTLAGQLDVPTTGRIREENTWLAESGISKVIKA